MVGKLSDRLWVRFLSEQPTGYGMTISIGSTQTERDRGNPSGPLQLGIVCNGKLHPVPSLINGLEPQRPTLGMVVRTINHGMA